MLVYIKALSLIKLLMASMSYIQDNVLLDLNGEGRNTINNVKYTPVWPTDTEEDDTYLMSTKIQNKSDYINLKEELESYNNNVLKFVSKLEDNINKQIRETIDTLKRDLEKYTPKCSALPIDYVIRHAENAGCILKFITKTQILLIQGETQQQIINYIRNYFLKDLELFENYIKDKNYAAIVQVLSEGRFFNVMEEDIERIKQEIELRFNYGLRDKVEKILRKEMEKCVPLKIIIIDLYSQITNSIKCQNDGVDDYIQTQTVIIGNLIKKVIAVGVFEINRLNRINEESLAKLLKILFDKEN